VSSSCVARRRPALGGRVVVLERAATLGGPYEVEQARVAELMRMWYATVPSESPGEGSPAASLGLWASRVLVSALK